MKDHTIKESNGILEISHANDLKISREGLYKYIKKNNYERVGPGMYISPNELADDLYILHKRCPKGVFSHDDALYHYGLVDREPVKHTITVYSGYNATRLSKHDCQIYYVNKDVLDLGKIGVIDNFGNIVPMYDLERTIIDLIRSRNNFEAQEFITALKSYSKRKDKNLSKLSNYAEVFRVSKILKTYMEVLL